MKIEEEKFMLANFQHINKLLIKIKDMLEINEKLKTLNYNYMKFSLKIDKNADEEEKPDQTDMLNKHTDGLSFNHVIEYDEKYAKWEIIMPNLENIKENHMHQCDNYDEEKFKFGHFIHYGKTDIHVYLQIYNLFNIPCYNALSFSYDTYCNNNLKIKEIETKGSLISLDEDGNLALSKVQSNKTLLLENRGLKLEVHHLNVTIEDLEEQQLRLKSEIEALEKEKLCKILTNKIYRVFGIKTMNKQD